MSLFQVYEVGLLIILGMMLVLWLISLSLKNSSIVDIFWGAGFVIANWAYFLLAPDGFIIRKLLISILVTLWGFRLSLHILMRNLGKPEDFRYQKWRDENGSAWWWRSFFKVFLLQGILLWLISAPLLAVQIGAKPQYLTVLDWLGVILWIIGFYFEAMGDLQLKRFLANPANKGKIMNKGVWRYTRHPNYFGDSAQWWGYFLIAASVGGWWTIFSPIMMTFLLVRVSGAALLEKSMSKTSGYREYMESTSGFIPWFPRKPKES